MTEQIATLRENKPDVFKLTVSLYIMIIYSALAPGRLRQALPGAGSSRPAARLLTTINQHRSPQPARVHGTK